MKKKEQKKKNKEIKKERKLDLRGYENELIERLKYKKSEDNENSKALKEIDRYIISTYRTYITENERAKEDREKIKCKESKKCIRGYYGLRLPPQNDKCCEGHRDFLNRHISIKENLKLLNPIEHYNLIKNNPNQIYQYKGVANSLGHLEKVFYKFIFALVMN